MAGHRAIQSANNASAFWPGCGGNGQVGSTWRRKIAKSVTVAIASAGAITRITRGTAEPGDSAHWRNDSSSPAAMRSSAPSTASDSRHSRFCASWSTAACRSGSSSPRGGASSHPASRRVPSGVAGAPIHFVSDACP